MNSAKKHECPVCHRHFGSKAALRQHRASSHEKAVAVRPAVQRKRPNVVRNVSRNISTNKVVVSGVDLVSTFSIVKNQTLGYRLFNVALSPMALPDTRLSQQAGLWARWRPLKLTVDVNILGASTVFGGVTCGWVGDPTFSYNANEGINGVRRVLSFSPNKSFNMNGKGSMALPCESSRKWYQTTGDHDQSSHGSILAVVSAIPGGFTDRVSGLVTLHWTVEFEMAEPPRLDTPVTSYITPDSGFNNLFTTSDGSFSSEILTFKMHHGGDMVPWTSAKPNVVYTVSGATKVPYYDQSGANRDCKYFARVQNYTVPGLLLFADFQSAQDYIRTGNLDKALKYRAAGNIVTPEIPRLMGTLMDPKPSTSYQQLEQRIDELTQLVMNLQQPARASVTMTSDFSTYSSVKEVTAQLRKGLQVNEVIGEVEVFNNALSPLYVAPIVPAGESPSVETISSEDDLSIIE